MRALALAALGGTCMAYGNNMFPPSAFVGMALFVWMLHDATPRKALVLGLVFGGFESLAFSSFAVPGWDLYFFCALIHAVTRATLAVIGAILLPRTSALLGIPLCFVGLEWLRGLSAYHPLPIGDAFGHFTMLIQIADLGGTYLIGFVVALVGTALATRKVVVAAATVAIVFVYGYFAPPAPREHYDRSAAIAQMSVPYWFYNLAKLDAVHRGPAIRLRHGDPRKSLIRTSRPRVV